MVSRRSILAGIIMAPLAPAIIRSGVLMPIKPIPVAPAYDGSLSGMRIAMLQSQLLAHAKPSRVLQNFYESKLLARSDPKIVRYARSNPFNRYDSKILRYDTTMPRSHIRQDQMYT